MSDTKKGTAELEKFGCAVMRGAYKTWEFREGVRASAHFAFIDGSLTHLPSGRMLPYTQCETIKESKRRAAMLEALPFIDWSSKTPTSLELDAEQLGALREASMGEVANG